MNNQVLDKYATLILEYNKIHMLTGFKTRADIFDYLFDDSFQSFKSIDLKNKKVLDIGTGAGIPGVVLKINNPSIDLTVIESLNKRVTFLQSLDVGDFTILNQRAELIPPHLVEQFDIVTSRAFYNLAMSLEIMSQYCKVKGLLVLIKGKSVDQEVKNCAPLAAKLKLKLIKTANHKIRDLTTKVLIYQKMESTPKIYPRPFAKLKRLSKNI